ALRASRASPERGRRRIGDAGPAEVSGYLGTLRQRGLGGRSVARHLSAVRGLYRFLAAGDVVARDPTEHIEGPRPPRRLPRTLSLEDVAALIETPDVSPPEGLRDPALFGLLSASGLPAPQP